MSDLYVPIERNRAGKFCPALEKTPHALVRKTIKNYPRGV
jgi:hypothetical protein